MSRDNTLKLYKHFVQNQIYQYKIWHLEMPKRYYLILISIQKYRPRKQTNLSVF